MNQLTALPQSATHALALARIADLRHEAERDRLARTARRAGGKPRRTPAWPAVVVAALRESLTGAGTRRAPVPAPDSSGSTCCA